MALRGDGRLAIQLQVQLCIMSFLPSNSCQQLQEKRAQRQSQMLAKQMASEAGYC